MAISNQTFGDFGGAVSDIFAGFGDEYKAEGAQFEAQSYEEAAALANQEAQFTATSTAIKQQQSDRALFTSLGRTTAAVAGAGLAQSGSALDILRESAQQGATTKAAIGQQGLITEAGYQEQAQSYENMAQAAEVAIKADKEAALGSFIGGGIDAIAGVASLF